MKFKRIKEIFFKVKTFITRDVWALDVDDLNKFKARFVKDLKIILITARDFGKQNLGIRAVALSFFTIMSLVPFLAVILAVANSFDLDEYLTELIYRYAENTDIVDILLGISNNLVRAAESGLYGFISFATFAWSVIWLMISVESTFNYVWEVEKSRVLWKRGLYSIGLLIVAPLVIVAFLSTFIYISDSLSTAPYIQYASDFIIWLILFAFIVLVFTLMYVAIPNMKVKFLPSLKAGLIAGLAFVVVQYLYLETQVFVTRMNSIYGVFAAIPLLMVWVNIGWYIIIVGSELSYAFQNVDAFTIENNQIVKINK